MTPFSRVPVAVWSDERLNLRLIKVLGAILSFADRAGRAHPTHRQISEVCRIREKDIPIFTAQLCQLGWLEKTGNGGRSSPCDYTVKTTPNSWVDSQGETTPDSRVVKTPPDLGVVDVGNHPQIAEKTTPNLRGGIQQTINRPVTDQ